MGGATTKILCFGDSLTAGYYMKGHMFHPYTIKLQSLLNKDGNYQLENQGRSGEGTTKMAERLKLHLSNNPSKYKYAIILGGIFSLKFILITIILKEKYFNSGVNTNFQFIQFKLFFKTTRKLGKKLKKKL
eukprot:TRINITY_DN4459_c0_g1_i2.p1 TRINITY_DN4459_c0_g1~~TRINITY_DN4459_c0_g1_i2.p1  ORF type:complete len:131 (-),score=24.92 TRINITY_DN4459_c0_g1_i2:25-417(-)